MNCGLIHRVTSHVFSPLYYTILYYTILYYTILYYTIVHFITATPSFHKLSRESVKYFSRYPGESSVVVVKSLFKEGSLSVMPKDKYYYQ